MSKFGPNGEQVERFLEIAQTLPFEEVESIAADARSQDVQKARGEALEVTHSAARHSALDAAARELVRTLRSEYPRPSSTAERIPMNGFSFLLTEAVFALASRPMLDDETVRLVVDPFAKRLGFEWRSWGVGEGDEKAPASTV